MFDTFLGNAHIVAALRRMIAAERLPQTLLFAGPYGVGKATLARLVAAALICRRAEPCGECKACRTILADDLSLPEYRELFEERAKLAPDKRRDNPLVIGSYPEFLTFPPDGPLEQISIDQVRKLKEHAQFGASEGRRRIFLVDRADRMDAAAANSLLKILEEPPAYLTLILTAENAFDLLPTIRSRSVPFYFAPLSRREMESFLKDHPQAVKLLAWGQGSPGRALSIDVEAYEERRAAMLAALQGVFLDLLPYTEALARSKQERIELYLDVLYGLLRDILRLKYGADDLVNEDIRADLVALADRLDFPWLEHALAQVDSVERHVRRNIQKQIALEALAVSFRLRTRL